MLQSLAARLTRFPRPKHAVFFRRAASPLHVRTLVSDSSPGHLSGDLPLRKDEAEFYRYYLKSFDQNWRKMHLQPWISELPPTDQDAGESLRRRR
jgi:hypothetical protein